MEKLHYFFTIIKKDLPQYHTWEQLQTLIFSTNLALLFKQDKQREYQLAIDDLLARLLDTRIPDPLKHLIISPEYTSSRTKAKIFGLIYRHGAYWGRQEVFNLSTLVQQEYQEIQASSTQESTIFVRILQRFHPGIAVYPTHLHMPINHGFPEPVNDFTPIKELDFF